MCGNAVFALGKRVEMSGGGRIGECMCELIRVCDSGRSLRSDGEGRKEEETYGGEWRNRSSNR